MKRTSPTSSAAKSHPRSTWHYGIVAKWWDEFNQGGPEIPYVRRFIDAHGQPALDVGCGTGRVLLPLLGDGLDVDGADVSADMLGLCSARAGQAGLHRFVDGTLERNELVLMLERVGFCVVDVQCDHSASSPTPDGTVHSFIARK